MHPTNYEDDSDVSELCLNFIKRLGQIESIYNSSTKIDLLIKERVCLLFII